MQITYALSSKAIKEPRHPWQPLLKHPNAAAAGVEQLAAAEVGVEQLAAAAAVGATVCAEQLAAATADRSNIVGIAGHGATSDVFLLR